MPTPHHVPHAWPQKESAADGCHVSARDRAVVAVTGRVAAEIGRRRERSEGKKVRATRRAPPEARKCGDGLWVVGDK